MTVFYPFVPAIQPPASRLPVVLISSGPVAHPLLVTATDSQSVATVGSAAHFRLVSATDAQVASFVRLASRFRTLAAASLQVAALATVRAYFRSLAAISSNVAAVLKSAVYSRAFSLAAAQSAALRRTVSAIRSAVDSQSVSLARLFARLLGAGSGQVSGLQKLAGALRSATNVQTLARKLAASIIRAATDSEVTALRVSNSLARSAVDAQAAARILMVSIARSAVDSEAAASVQSVVRSKILSAIDTQVAFLVATFNHAGVNTGQALAALQAQAVRLIKSAGIRRTMATGEATALARLVSGFRIFSVASAQAISLQRLTSIMRSVTSAQVVTRRLLVSVLRGIASAESLARALSLAVLRSTVTAQVLSIKRTSGAIRSLVGAQVSVLIKAVSVARASISAQTAAIVATHLGFTNPLSLAAIDAQAAALRRSVGVLRSALGAQAFNVVRLISAIRPIASPEVTARTLAVFKRLATTSGEATAGIALRAFLKACSALSNEAVALTRVGLHIPAALAVAVANSARLVKLASAVRRASNAMAAARGAFSIGLHLPADPLQVIGIAAVINRGRALVSQQAQSVLAFAAFHHFGNFSVVASTVLAGAISLAKTIGKAFHVAEPTRTMSFSWYFRFVPLALRGRVVRLPPPQQFSALPPAARRVVLPEAQLLVMLPPAVRRVIVPAEGDDMSDYEVRFAEPAFFSPLDPTDTDIFTFDWSIRGYPGDVIVFASIISVPTGVVFLGPAFISGQSVSITVGPFAVVPAAPITYSLRCMAMFSSGRISNYSVPFEVHNL